MKKVLVMVGIIVFVALGWFVMLTRVSNHEDEDKIKLYKKLAEEQIELGAYGSAINYYTNIIDLEASEENYLKLAEIYKKAGKDRSYKETLEGSIEAFPDKVKAYEELASYYQKMNAYQECVDVIRQANANELMNDTLWKLYYDAAYQYYFLYTGLGEAGRFYNGYALVTINGKKIFIDEKMESASVQYDNAFPYISLITGITLDGKSYYVDTQGEKYFDSKASYEEVSAFSEDFSLALENGKYYYISSTNQKIWDGYEAATLFKNGIAAVKEKKKWKIIDTSGKAVNDMEYTEVLVDEDNICSNSGVVFVSEGKGYYMIDTEGEKISDTVYEDAKPFFEEDITAVKKDGKWGFVNKEGEIIIKPQYEDAQTFGSGIGAVLVEDEWGFVNAENKMVIEPEFEEAKCFSANGIAPVKSAGTWGYIKLNVQ